MKLVKGNSFEISESIAENFRVLESLQKEKETWKGFSAHLIDAENPRKLYLKVSAHLGIEEGKGASEEQESSQERLASRLAVFLFQDYFVTSDNLYKVLGGAEPISKITLDKFLGLFNFYDQTVEEALRVFFLMFLMKGEAQMVERVLSGLSTRFFNHNVPSFVFI